MTDAAPPLAQQEDSPARSDPQEHHTESDTQQTAESLAVQNPRDTDIAHPAAYKIMDVNGMLVVCDGSGEHILFETGISAAQFDQETQQKLADGICFLDEKELFAFLESYSS